MSRTNLDAVERKYIVYALETMIMEHERRFKPEEQLIFIRLICKLKSGIRYDRSRAKAVSSR